MPARGNIALADGEAAPVTHTFVPNGDLANGIAAYINRNASVPAASEIATLSVRPSSASVEDYSRPGKKVAPTSVEFRIRYPATYVDGVSGLTLVDFVDEAILSFKIHPRSSEQRRKNLRVMCYGSLATALTQLSGTIDRCEPVW